MPRRSNYPEQDAWNVAYTDERGDTKHYLACHVPTYEKALLYARSFNQKYGGKPYPNGKGFYSFSQAVPVRIV